VVLPAEESDECDQAGAKKRQRPVAAPPVAAQLDQGVGHGDQTHHRAQHADGVQSRALGCSRLRHQCDDGDQTNDSDRDVEQEDPTPPVVRE
jgi:hypothetical protein